VARKPLREDVAEVGVALKEVESLLLLLGVAVRSGVEGIINCGASAADTDI
jgi:hypothetical protein